MARVFWDTNLFIYFFENFGLLSDRTVALFERMVPRGDQLLTSALALGELLVKPVQDGDFGVADEYSAHVLGIARVLPFDEQAARIFAEVRATTRIKAPDAIQLACAAAAGTDLFITNDDRLSRLIVPGVQFITSLERSPI